VADRLHKDASERGQRRRNARSSEEHSERHVKKINGAREPGISFGRSTRATPVAFFRAPGDLVNDMNPRRGPTPSWVAERANDDTSSNALKIKRITKGNVQKTIPASAETSARRSPQHRTNQVDDEDKRKQFQRRWWATSYPEAPSTSISHECKEPNMENPHDYYTRSLRRTYSGVVFRWTTTSGTTASDQTSSGGPVQKMTIDN